MNVNENVFTNHIKFIKMDIDIFFEENFKVFATIFNENFTPDSRKQLYDAIQDFAECEKQKMLKDLKERTNYNWSESVAEELAEFLNENIRD